MITRTAEEQEGAAAENAVAHNMDWFTLFDLFLDASVIFISASDIILDVLVTVEFYQLGHMECFWISTVIFISAQVSYAFLFACTWARDCNAWSQVFCFFFSLPFGQFIPFFTFVESFHFESVDRIINNMGLTPTEQIALSDGQDSLWLYLQNKYQAWSGFLIEAFVEAIPQCLLQTIAVVVYGRATTLNLLSIIVSVVVIASKGYLISYSLDRKTFIFNMCCVACDCFNLFAIITWLFHDEARLLFHSAWSWFALPGMGLCGVAGFALLMFSIFDDHLKVLHGKIKCKNVAYTFYFVRIIGWFLAIELVSVLYHVTKLTLIPIFVFRSLDPEQSMHFEFYTHLFKFLEAEDSATRLRVVNAFFAQARLSLDDLKVRLDKRLVRQNSGLKRAEISKWAKKVGQSEVNDHFLEALLAATVAAQSDEAAQAQIRKLNLEAGLEASRADANSKLEEKSVIISGLAHTTTKQWILAWLAKISLGCLMFFGALWAVVAMCHIVYGVFFPLSQLGRCFTNFNGLQLQCILTFGNAFFFVCLVGLGPVVYKFQMRRHGDLVNLRGFPAAFYTTEVLDEIKVRYAIVDMLQDFFGNCAQDIVSFLH